MPRLIGMTVSVFSLLMFLAVPATAQQRRLDYLTVCLEVDQNKVEVRGISMHFFDDELDLLVHQTEGEKLHVLTASEKGIAVDGHVFDTPRLRIKSTQNWLKVGEHIFREDMLAVRMPDNPNKIALVNEIQLEGYLYGLINKECLASWPLEAKKAQAVAARTYAMHRKVTRKREVCDLLPSQLDQMYGGYLAEDNAARLAVDQTRGEVMVHKNQFAKAYYHSTSGGRTASSADVWDDPQPYLISVDSPYSKNSPHHEWTVSMSKDELGAKLGVPKAARKGFLFSIMARDSGGRVQAVKISHDSKSSTMSGAEFRKRVGYTVLKSTWFTFQTKAGTVTFRGKGSGHGVGMDQYGAAGMAEAGRDYAAILKHFYRGVELRKIY